MRLEPLKKDKVSIVFAGVGGQGIITASDICASCAVLAGYDVKKYDSKGIARRKGRVISAVTYGEKVYSPKIDMCDADIIIDLNGDLTSYDDNMRIYLSPEKDILAKYPGSFNIFMLGRLSGHLPFNEDTWRKAVTRRFSDEGVYTINMRAFSEGRESIVTQQNEQCAFMDSSIPLPRTSRRDFIK